ncbi:MAG: MarR family transcriptional regulator [Pseudomonadota bacterium]
MQLYDRLPHRIARLASLVGSAISDVHLGRFGLNRDEWHVLCAVGEAEGRPTRVVAELTGLDKVAISRAATGLEDRGLIQRREDRTDRRIKILHLAPEGRETLEAAAEQIATREAFLLDGLDPLERSMLDQVMGKLDARAQALMDGRAPLSAAARAAAMEAAAVPDDGAETEPAAAFH